MKKILFAFMAFMLAFTSCQQSTGSDEAGVSPTPPSPTTEATEYTVSVTQPDFGGTVSVDKSKAKASETITITTTANDGFELETISMKNGEATVTVTDKKFTMPSGNVTVNAAFAASSYTVKWDNGIFENKFSLAKVKAYITQIGLVETTHYSIDKKNGVLTFTSVGYAKVANYLNTNGEPTVTETPTTPTDSTQWNLVASVIKHENGVGKNDGAFHGTISLNKAKANTGDTVTITVTPDSDYELGELFLGPISGEKQSIGKVNSFTMPNYAVEVTARFDPVDGYTVNLVDTWNDPFLIKYDGNTSKTFKANENAYFIVMDSYFDAINLNNWTIILDGVDISDCQLYSKENYTFGFPKTECKKVFFKMPVHDVTIEVKKK